MDSHFCNSRREAVHSRRPTTYRGAISNSQPGRKRYTAGGPLQLSPTGDKKFRLGQSSPRVGLFYHYLSLWTSVYLCGPLCISVEHCVTLLPNNVFSKHPRTRQRPTDLCRAAAYQWNLHTSFVLHPLSSIVPPHIGRFPASASNRFVISISSCWLRRNSPVSRPSRAA